VIKAAPRQIHVGHIVNLVNLECRPRQADVVVPSCKGTGPAALIALTIDYVDVGMTADRRS